MKWYIALNEGGTSGDIALHTKLAVLSARRNTSLRPHLLYTGKPNAFTRWLQDQGVRLVPSAVPYESTIQRLAAENRYSTATLGHWLRTNVCLEEFEDAFVLYTDVDVIFQHDPYLRFMQPGCFSAAPEFDPSCWNYFNAGVMVVNVEGLRADYASFEAYLVRNISERTYAFHDQIAYNEFYRGRWDRLPLELNWKPYWGRDRNAALVHFHGPKISAIAALVDGRWNHSDVHGAQIAGLFDHNVSHYAHYLRACLENAPDLPAQDFDTIAVLAETVAAFEPARGQGRGDLSFTRFRMFADPAQPALAA